MSFGRPVLPVHLQGYPVPPGLMEGLDYLLQERFAQLESRLDTKFAQSRFNNETDLRESLIRIEEKVSVFQNIFDQVEHLTRTTDAILSHVRAGNSSNDFRSPGKSGGISISLLPTRPSYNEATSLSADKTNDEVLRILHTIDQKISNDGIKTTPPWLGNPFPSENLSSDRCSDLKVYIEEKLAPVEAVSDKLDTLIKQDKDLGAKILVEFSSVHKTLDDVYKKSSDAKSLGSEVVDSTEVVLKKVEKLKKVVEEHSLKTQVAQIESGVETILKMLANRTFDKPEVSKASRSKHQSDAENDDANDAHLRSRSSSGDVTSVHYGEKKKGKKAKKRSRSTSEDSDKLDDKNVVKLLGSVNELESRLESWMKTSKKSMHKTDETTNCLLQQLLTINKTLENLIRQQKSIEEQVCDWAKVKTENPVPDQPNYDAIFQMIVSIDEKVGRFGHVLETLQKDQNGYFKNLSEDVMAISDRTERLSKIEEIMAKLKIIYKQASSHESSLTKMLKGVENSVEQVNNKLTENSDSKSTIRDTILVMRDLMPKMDDFYTRVLPVMEDLKKLHRQTADQDELQEKQNSVNLQKILGHLEDIASSKTSSRPSDPRSLPTDMTLLQVFSAINDLKNQFGQHDQNTQKFLTDLKIDSSKSSIRLSEILKTKLKLVTSIDELKQNSANDMKTLSTMNTMLQSIKQRSSAGDAKLESVLKELKQTIAESRTSDDVTKIVADVKAGQDELTSTVTKHNEDTMRLVRRLHEEILETSDVKILESAIENQSALTAKSVVETLRSDPVFSRNSSDLGGHSIVATRPKDFEDKMIGHFAGFVGQMEKISGTVAQVLSSVEDIKQRSPTAILAPKLEKISKDLHELPNDIGAYSAALEENLAKNMESFIKDMYKTVLQEILGKFDVIDQRLAVIKKYAKYGSNARGESTPTNPTKAEESEASASETSSLADQVTSDVLTSSQPTLLRSMSSSNEEVIRHVTSECRILGDCIANTLDQFIASADTSQVRQTLEAHDTKISLLLQELTEINRQILNEQAKSQIVEEQFEALAQTVLQPIQEIKPIQEQIVNLVECEMKALIKTRKQPDPALTQNLDKMLNAQQDCLSLLNAIKRFHEFSSDDRLRDLICANINNAVSALARNEAEEKSTHQTEAVKNLVEFLKRIQATQQDILLNADKSVEYQASLNEALFQIIPVLELIHRSLKDRRLESGPLPDLCNDFRTKLLLLSDLEKKLISDKNDRCHQDLCSLVQMCKTVIEQLNIDDATKAGFNVRNVETNTDDIDPLSCHSMKGQETSQTSRLGAPTKSKSRSNWGPKTKRFKLISNDDDDHSKNFGNGESSRNSSLVLHSDSSKAICPKLTTQVSQFGRRKSATERRPSREGGEVVAKDSDRSTIMSPKISEEEAKKKKFQPQVVVEKIDTTALTGTFNN